MQMTHDELAEAIQAASDIYRGVPIGDIIARGNARQHLEKLQTIQQQRAAREPSDV